MCYIQSTMTKRKPTVDQPTRSHELHLRLTAHELASIQRAADAKALTTSAYARMILVEASQDKK